MKAIVATFNQEKALVRLVVPPAAEVEVGHLAPPVPLTHQVHHRAPVKSSKNIWQLAEKYMQSLHLGVCTADMVISSSLPVRSRP